MVDLTNKKILLVRNDNIGDLICTTPAIEALRKKYPSVKIDIVVNSYNEVAIKNNPNVDKIYSYTKPKHLKSVVSKLKAFFGKAQMLYEIYKAKYDAVVIFRGDYSRSAELFAKAARSKIIVGVKNKKGSGCVTHPIIGGENIHEVEFCFEALKHFAVEYDGEMTKIYPNELLQKKFGYASGAIIFHISSRKPQNRLKNEQWIELAKKTKELGNLFVNSAKSDSDVAAKIAKEADVGVVETASFDELVALLSVARLVVSVDGGALHIAPALGVKSIGVLGVTNMDRWHPWGAKEWCVKSPNGSAADLDVETIFEKIKALA